MSIYMGLYIYHPSTAMNVVTWMDVSLRDLWLLPVHIQRNVSLVDSMFHVIWYLFGIYYTCIYFFKVNTWVEKKRVRQQRSMILMFYFCFIFLFSLLRLCKEKVFHSFSFLEWNLIISSFKLRWNRNMACFIRKKNLCHAYQSKRIQNINTTVI